MLKSVLNKCVIRKKLSTIRIFPCGKAYEQINF